MKTVQPIRSVDDIDRMHRYLLAQSPRNALILMMMIYTGLRVGDGLQLRAGDVRGTHLKLQEQKTGKTKMILIADPLRKALNDYCKNLADDDLLFPSRQGYHRPIGRARAYEIIKAAAKACGLADIGTHSLRKTFGYFVYQQTGSLTVLCDLFNHRDEATTARYIGLNQDVRDSAVRKLGQILTK